VSAVRARMTSISTAVSRRPLDPLRELRLAVEHHDLGRAADLAIPLGIRAAGVLPANLRSDFETILQAFAHYDSGRDDAARESLQSIAINSPWLDWKLLIRGLLAYATGDDGRALDNWQRLEAKRLPAQLIAPLRASLDPAFRIERSPEQQLRLRIAADKLRLGPLATLRQIQTTLGRPEKLGEAFADIKALLPRIRRIEPELEAALGRCCYGALWQAGIDGAEAQRALFAPPDHDPTLDRLQALAAERRDDWQTANRHWRRYDAVLEHLTGFTDDDRRRARALVWRRCGNNAERVESPIQSKRPSAAEMCYRRAIEIDPSATGAQIALFDYFRQRNRFDATLAVGRKLAELCSNNVSVIASLAELAFEIGSWDAAIEWFAAARKLCPFNRDFTAAYNQALRLRARERAAAGDLRGAASDLHSVSEASISVLCQRSALASAIGNAVEADKLATEANLISGIGATFAMLAELTRLRQPRSARTVFEKEWKLRMTVGGSTADAIAIAEVALEQANAGHDYRGFRSHLAQVRKFIERSIGGPTTTAESNRLGELLEGLGWNRLKRGRFRREQLSEAR
jgi:tetratricopeptide (TPR) repeat protein